MKLLITGGKGQLGWELCRALESGRTALGTVPEALRNCTWRAVDVDELDITDARAVLQFVREFVPDAVINCAAMTNVDGCETNELTAFRVNAVGVRNLAAACDAVGARFLHVSTDYVFDGTGHTPHREWDVCAPNTVYGRSKYLGEQYALHFCRKAFVVRTAWLYGAGGNNFVKTMQRLGREKDRISVVCDQRGNPTYAGDLAHHLLKLCVTEEYGIYHCTGEGECSWYEFACEIMHLSDLACEVNPCTTAEYPSKTPRPAYSALENLALAATVGNEMRDWKEALTAYITETNV